MHARDNVRQTRELTYVVGHANARSHLWKFATWRFVCRGLTVLIQYLQYCSSAPASSSPAHHNEVSTYSTSCLFKWHLLMASLGSSAPNSIASHPGLLVLVPAPPPSAGGKGGEVGGQSRGLTSNPSSATHQLCHLGSLTFPLQASVSSSVKWGPKEHLPYWAVVLRATWGNARWVFPM